jgi:hypothetical protein
MWRSGRSTLIAFPNFSTDAKRKNIMKLTNRSGVAIATAAAVFVLAGAALAPAAEARAAKGHCIGANACKGKSACKTASNACKGLNSCKGQGFLEKTKSECKKIKGAHFESGM